MQIFTISYFILQLQFCYTFDIFLVEDNTVSWTGSDRDYTYDELLNRVFEIMRDKNPDMVAGKKQKFVMRPPQVVRIGTKKTSFANFTEICKTLHRQAKHLLDFLLAELGTSGSVDGNNQLIIKGRFQQKQIENVLRRYIKEYVTCHTCRSPDTILQKDTRLFFLQCETCGSRCSVASIKSGFQVSYLLYFIITLFAKLTFTISGCYFKTCCYQGKDSLVSYLQYIHTYILNCGRFFSVFNLNQIERCLFANT